MNDTAYTIFRNIYLDSCVLELKCSTMNLPKNVESVKATKCHNNIFIIVGFFFHFAAGKYIKISWTKKKSGVVPKEYIFKHAFLHCYCLKEIQIIFIQLSSKYSRNLTSTQTNKTHIYAKSHKTVCVCSFYIL